MKRIAEYRRVEGAAATWWFAPDRAAALAPLLADAVERLARLPGAAILRENRSRRLISLPLPGGVNGFAKLFLRKEGLQLLLDQLRPKAVREASALLAAEGVGVGVPRPVAFAVGYGPEVAGVLVTEALPDAQPLQQVLERSGRLLRGEAFRARRALLRRLGELAARLEEAGWRHGDLHTGNILLSPPTLEGRPYVIDWQRARRGRGFPPDLVDLVYSLSQSVPATEQMAALRAGLPRTATRGLRREVCGWVRWRKERHVESRTSRCLKSGTEFAVDVDQDAVVYRQRTVASEWLREAVREHDAAAARGALAKALPRRRLSRLQLPGPGESYPVYVKEYIHTPLRRVANLLCGGPARCAWVAAQGLRWRGIRTPEALGLVEEGRRSLIVTREVASARPLAEAACEAARGPHRAKREFLERLARWVRRIHEEGIWHPDLKANNVLADASGEFHLLDLDRTRFVGYLTRARREKNLAQLCAAVPRPVSRADRMRFWRVYSRLRGTKEAVRRVLRMAIRRKHVWPGMT